MNVNHIHQPWGLESNNISNTVNTAVYIKNRCPTKALNSKTPQEAWSGRKPDVFHLRVFGCKPLHMSLMRRGPNYNPSPCLVCF